MWYFEPLDLTGFKAADSGDNPYTVNINDPPKIAILLSTFNGERWLSELMQSLADQTLSFELIWRDDGSIDATREVVRRADWCQLTEAQHSDAGKNIGACASYGVLMQTALHSEADIFFLADQDDIWRADKLEKMVARCSALSSDQPLLIHHDLRVVEENGAEIAPSLWRFMRLDAEQTEVARFLTRNSITGCATAVNRALLEKAAPVPDAALMHDWWLGLIASVFGHIHIEEARLVDYRQHAGNTLGAKGFFHGLNPFTNWIAGWKRGNEEYRSLFSQARALLEVLQAQSDAPPKDLATVEHFVAMPDLPLMQRCTAANRLGLRDRSSVLWLVAMLRVVFTKVSQSGS